MQGSTNRQIGQIRQSVDPCIPLQKFGPIWQSVGLCTPSNILTDFAVRGSLHGVLIQKSNRYCQYRIDDNSK